jgi:hypothetical protein
MYAIKLNDEWFQGNSADNRPLFTKDITKRALFASLVEASSTAVARSYPQCRITELPEPAVAGNPAWRDSRPTAKELRKLNESENI